MTNRTFKPILFITIILGGFLLCRNACSTTIHVADFGDGTANKANFDLAYAAAATGDTILFPLSGAATWSETAVIGKAVTVNGNGTTLTQGGPLPYGFFRITGFSSTDLMRITGFTFNLLPLPAASSGIMSDAVTLTKLRIDHNTFHKGAHILNIGGAWGVIDNNYFYNNSSVCEFSAGSRNQADDAWAHLNPGTVDALFLENNHFIIDGNFPYDAGTDNGNACDAHQGGNFVYRYNTFDYTASPSLRSMGTISPHGSASGGCPNGYWQSNDCARRSPAIMEVYNNRMVGYRIDRIFAFRGGSALVFNNYHEDSYPGTARINFMEEEFRTDESGQWTPTRSAWPAEDMIHNTFIWNNIIDGKAQSDNNIGIPDFNSYCTGNGTPMVCCSGAATGTCNNGQANALIKKDREYFMHAPQAGGGKSSWVCVDGVTDCNGSASSYPTDGITLPTYGTQVFSSLGANAYYPYTPYTCPHPLTGLSGFCDSGVAGTEGYNIAAYDTAPPAAPAGLTIQ